MKKKIYQSIRWIGLLLLIFSGFVSPIRVLAEENFNNTIEKIEMPLSKSEHSKVENTFEKPEPIKITEDILAKEKPIAHSLNTLKTPAIESSIALSPENKLTIPPQATSKQSSSSNDDFYVSLTDYLTEEGQAKYVEVVLYPGEVLHAQLDLPNSEELDYDLYLLDENLSIVDYSNYTTYLTIQEGVSKGTLSEAVGTINKANAPKTFYVYIQSYMGGSISMPFSIHVGINTTFDSFETDEHARYAIPFTLQKNIDTVIVARSMDTRCDNDWYKFTVPNNSNYSKINMKLDNSSAGAGHKIEVYSNLADGGMKKENSSSNYFMVEKQKTYYLRVTSTGSSNLINSNYQLTISPEFVADEVFVAESLFSGGTFISAYVPGEILYRVESYKNFIVKGVAASNGFLLPNNTVKVTLENLSWNPASLRYTQVTVKTDSQGYFTAVIPVGSSPGYNTYYLNNMFIHYYDYGKVYAESGAVKSNEVRVYILAQSRLI